MGHRDFRHKILYPFDSWVSFEGIKIGAIEEKSNKVYLIQHIESTALEYQGPWEEKRKEWNGGETLII